MPFTKTYEHIADIKKLAQQSWKAKHTGIQIWHEGSIPAEAQKNKNTPKNARAPLKTWQLRMTKDN